MLHIRDIRCRAMTGTLIRLGKLVRLKDIQKRCTSSCFLPGDGHGTPDTRMMAEHVFLEGLRTVWAPHQDLMRKALCSAWMDR